MTDPVVVASREWQELESLLPRLTVRQRHIVLCILREVVAGNAEALEDAMAAIEGEL